MTYTKINSYICHRKGEDTFFTEFISNKTI